MTKGLCRNRFVCVCDNSEPSHENMKQKVGSSLKSYQYQSLVQCSAGVQDTPRASLSLLVGLQVAHVRYGSVHLSDSRPAAGGPGHLAIDAALWIIHHAHLYRILTLRSIFKK